MATVIIDGQEIQLGDDERLNGIQAARRAGVEIPQYCWHPGLSVVASCRMCLVESGTKNAKTGEVSMFPKLVPACQTPAKDGTVFVTNSPNVLRSRAQVEESLLIDHPIDCPICDKAGECLLQDYHFAHGQAERRADIRPFTSRRRDVGPTVTLFVDRCVMCTRCVRFCREVSGTSELLVINRGSQEEIDVVQGFPLENKLAGNVVDLCPVGALGDKDFLYEQRVWFMRPHAGVCTRCSTGCSIWVEENQDRIFRLKPRANPHVNEWWMCDLGRYGYHHVHDEFRQIAPCRRVADQSVADEWSEIVNELPKRLASAGHLAAVISPHLTVEEAWLLCSFIREIDPTAELVLGPVPHTGDDERFPRGFVIHAEKCPNRLGVEAIIAHFSGSVTPFEQFLTRLESGGIGGVWISGGYPEPWIEAAAAEQFKQVDLIVVQDLFASPVWELAHFQLPGASFAEREGSYVNYAHRLQSVRWAVRPPAGVWVEGQLFWRLLGRTGLYNARGVLSDVAAQVPYFAAAGGPVPNTGIDLRLNQLAPA